MTRSTFKVRGHRFGHQPPAPAHINVSTGEFANFGDRPNRYNRPHEGSKQKLKAFRRAQRNAQGEPVITHVYAFTNGQIMVFDQYGKQMPAYQGETKVMLRKIRAAGFKGDIPLGEFKPRSE